MVGERKRRLLKAAFQGSVLRQSVSRDEIRKNFRAKKVKRVYRISGQPLTEQNIDKSPPPDQTLVELNDHNELLDQLLEARKEENETDRFNRLEGLFLAQGREMEERMREMEERMREMEKRMREMEERDEKRLRQMEEQDEKYLSRFKELEYATEYSSMYTKFLTTRDQVAYNLLKKHLSDQLDSILKTCIRSKASWENNPSFQDYMYEGEGAKRYMAFLAAEKYAGSTHGQVLDEVHRHFLNIVNLGSFSTSEFGAAMFKITKDLCKKRVAGAHAFSVDGLQVEQQEKVLKDLREAATNKDFHAKELRDEKVLKLLILAVDTEEEEQRKKNSGTSSSSRRCS